MTVKRIGWVLFGVAVGVVVVAERLRPLRRRTEPGVERLARNATIGAIAAVTTVSAATAIVRPVQRWAERRRVGLLRVLALPAAVRILAGFLLLDYTLFLWHWLNHRSRTLWRFHAVHHIDLDLDASTGLRFHFGELALSVGLRAVQILLLGVDRKTLELWSRTLFISVLFHHSNIALEPAIERALSTVVVTPRMHGIHHSTRRSETNSNYSSLLSWWDRAHRLFRIDVRQEAITIGVPGFARAEDVTLARSLALPFSSTRLTPPLIENGAGPEEVAR